MLLPTRLTLWFLCLFVAPVVMLWFFLTQPTFASNPRSEVRVSPAALEGHVRMLSETFHPRTFRDLDNLNRTADYIAGKFKAAGATIRFQEFELLGNTYRNVIGTFGSGRDGLFVIGAHYDAHQRTPGADDNASGVAGLIELAVLIGESSLKEQSIELVAYTLEEPPFFGGEDMGSYRHAQLLHENATELKAMICLEMIGYFSDKDDSQEYPSKLLEAYYPNQGNFIAVIGNMKQIGLTRSIKKGMQGTTELPVYSLNAPEAVAGVNFSDHRSYWSFGYKAAMITDTAFYRNPSYHQPTDTADQLNYEKMAMVVIGLFEYLRTEPSP